MSTNTKILAVTESRQHLRIKIKGYSSTRSGRCVASGRFTAGGHRWSVAYYPNGINAFSKGYVSLYLVLQEDVVKPVRARVQFGFAAEERRRCCLCLPCFPEKKIKPSPLFKSADLQFQSHGVHGCAKLIKRSDLEKSRYLRDDSFTIRCDIVVFNGFRAQEVTPAAKTSGSLRALVSVPPPDLGRHLLETGIGADVMFKVRGETFAAHRWLVAARCLAFSTELQGPTQKSGAVVRVNKMDPRVFRALLSFMYTDSLSFPETTTKQEEVALSLLLLVAAHRYGIERLKLLSEESLCRSIEVGTAPNFPALAELLGRRGLKDACFDFLGCCCSPENLKAVMASDGFEHLSLT